MLLLAIAVAGGYLILAWKLEQMAERIEQQHNALRRLGTEADERITKQLHQLASVVQRIDER